MARVRAPRAGRIRSLEPSAVTIFIIVTGAIAVIGFTAVATSPVSLLVGEGAFKLLAAFHGIAAFIFLLSATITLYLGWRLLIGEIKAFEDLKVLSVFNSFLAAVTVFFGNWIYIAFRSPGGPREYFLETNPAIHRIFFEFKEFMAIFTIPIAVVAAYLLWSQDKRILGDPRLRAIVAALLALLWVYLVISFGLGAAITKLRSV
ncbi:MAG: hypothetical protein ACE5LS_00835 [Thermoplasmata archaeon]